jgi:hypothetical protein
MEIGWGELDRDRWRAIVISWCIYIDISRSVHIDISIDIFRSIHKCISINIDIFSSIDIDISR